MWLVAVASETTLSTLSTPHLLGVHGDALGGGQLLQALGILAHAPLLLPGVHLLLWGGMVGGSFARLWAHAFACRCAPLLPPIHAPTCVLAVGGQVMTARLEAP